MSTWFFHALCILLPLLATVLAFAVGGRLRRLYVHGVRVLLGAFMLGGGLYKLSDNQIPGLMGPPMDHAFLARHSLEIFAQFIGFAQLLIGLLLLTGRFALLGAVLLVPMWLNIIVLTWSLRWPGTPFLTTGFLVLNLGLLLHDFPRLKWLFYPAAQPQALQKQPLRSGPSALEALWWLGAGIVLAGSLLYPVSLATMKAVMLGGLLVLLGSAAALRRAG